MFADQSFFWDIVISLKRMAIGYTFVVIIGIVGGLLLGRVKWLHRFLGTLIVALQAMPGIVWVPVATLVFGLTEAAVIFTIVLGGTGIVRLPRRAGNQGAFNISAKIRPWRASKFSGSSSMACSNALTAAAKLPCSNSLKPEDSSILLNSSTATL